MKVVAEKKPALSILEDPDFLLDHRTAAKIKNIWQSRSPDEKLGFLTHLGNEKNVAYWVEQGALEDVDALPVKVWRCVHEIEGELTLSNLLEFMRARAQAR